MAWLSAALLSGSLSSCSTRHAAAAADSGTSWPDGGSSSPDGGTATAGIAGAGLFARLPGLWEGQAAQTPLGSFPEVIMDFRAADSHWLFGRTDLDSQNSLRFGFAVESVNGTPALVYRNGGYFNGLERDTDTVLVDADEDAGTYHFCAETSGCFFSVDGGCLPVTGGCGFVDAVFSFSAADQMVFNAHVNGQEHEIWTVTRKQTEAVASPSLANAAPLPTDAGWPDLPQLSVTVSWSSALAQATDVWVILSSTPCASLSSPAFTCTPSRAIYGSAAAGATSIALEFDQILPGTYNAVALVDIAGNFQSTLSPAPGDGVSDPSATVTVPTTGAGTGSLAIVYYLP